MSYYQAFSSTVIGISHSKYDKECQDFSAHHFSKNADVAIAVVADGHGAEECFRSAKGAEIAAHCAIKSIAEFIFAMQDRFTARFFHKAEAPSRTEFEKLLLGNVKHIVAGWHNEVEQDYTANPFTQKELESAGDKYREAFASGTESYKAYGTTLIACAVTPDYWFGIHIGDGRLTALYKDGTCDQPVPWDERCFLNVTTSICDEDAADRARVYYCPRTEKEAPLAVFLCSDGIDDNYPVDDNEKHLFKLYRTILQTFAEDGFDSTCVQLKDLANSFATKGKGDDTSIAGFIDMDAVKATAETWKKQIEDEGEKVANPSAEKPEESENNRVEAYGTFVPGLGTKIDKEEKEKTQ
ncbi:MAG: hypothetical protein Ta2A_11300 [Treponemataceae bacterium]|nr:MAG: hypothetical protein Ta2A_11300 [Treponemataceae bacterium]